MADPIHLLGVGKVGLAWLRQFPERSTGSRYRFVGASDRSGSVYAPGGLSPTAVLQWKEARRPLAQLPGLSELGGVCTDELSVPAGAVVVDATDSEVSQQQQALQRTLRLIDGCVRVVTAAKTALLAGACELLAEPRRRLFGCNAALGGTGRELLAGLDQRRAHTREIVCVPNATTTRVIECVEAGATIAAGLERCRDDGLLEADPTQDISGVDAALKLVVVHNVVFGSAAKLSDVALPSPLTEAAIRRAQGSDCTLRLVGRATSDALRLEYEAVARDDGKAIPSTHVFYGYYGDGAQEYTGAGVGADETAAAIWEDLA